MTITDDSSVDRVYEFVEAVRSQVTDDEIRRLEAELAIRLPPAYRRYLQGYNGGDFAYCGIDTSAADDAELVAPPDDAWLEQLHSASTPPENFRSLWANHEYRVVRDGEAGYLLIGTTISGDFLYVTLYGDDADAIILRREEEWFTIATSIQDFFAHLKLDHKGKEKWGL